MKQFLLLPILLLLAELTFAQSDTIQFRHFDKGKNIIGLKLLGGFGAKMVIGVFSLRYGHFWLKQFNAGLESGFSINGYDYLSYHFQPFGRYYILNRKLSPFLETSYSYKVIMQSNDSKGGLTGIENSIFAISGLAYTGNLRRFGIELYGGYNYAVFYYINHPTDMSNYIKNSFTNGLRINFHF